ncbi:kinetoplast-associated protein-like protein [Leishmania donovani]|uniref:Kinetoplast-associated protein-like protein n=3 Tax=Leishmania donovani species complex TaxID=38574 RepID=A4HU01_LEIIN|nr:kinetoplast-associated protein-like protein [Leishmania infantum JPCM5]CAC9454446.1 kinetoplast-associated_protein-like_protein [Leishmania infantum]CAJ1986592.1 kinetoplast-associated protein-like protein [Leishmania donovani]CAM65907.1 kinetoplast-associated protein-like protein [Leishmania infantum JPCM5]SUZ39534.1 kinetoplast-associated_protein-like_protein [Leishmania infantum]VDZ42488.1 kinetoplast-associated_protein-like_protein/GeneDB:LmjF.09.0800 [Leishmania donovani]|eukprot:XP_001463542.1 kinetoplast-associated protein-like protein [Leishmania infantum JPCM5]
MPASACQTVLIQPWISLASTAGSHGDAGHASPSGGTSRRSPSSEQHGVTSAVRLAEINAMQRELEAVEHFARGEGDGGDDDGNDKRLAGELSQAYTRVLAFRSQSRGYSSLRAGDPHRGSEEGTIVVVDNDDDDPNPELTRQIEHKLAEFRKRIANTLSGLKTARRDQRELQAAQKKVQVSLEDAKRQLREAQEKVQRIDKRHLHEIQGYRLPPAVVKHVMDAVLCVLGEKAKNWTAVVTAMRSPSFISNVVSFHHAQLTPADVQELKKNFISSPRFSYADVLRGSHALGQFHEWVIRQLQLIEAESAHAKFFGGKRESSQELALAREKVEAEAAELRHLEEELEALMREQARQLQERRSRTLSPCLAGGEALSQRPSPPLTKVLLPASESEGAAMPDPQRSRRPSMHATSGAEAMANNNGAAAVSDGAQRRSSTSVTAIAVPAGCSAAPHTAADAAAAMTDSAMEMTTDGVAAVNRPPTAVMLAQQQQLAPAMVSPGIRWICPHPGALHSSSYVLRSSILCVLGHQQERTSEKPGEASPDNETTTPAPDMFELTTAQQQFVAEALHGPVRALPPPPPSSATAGSERSSHAAIVTQHTKTFTGKEWETVVKNSPDKLHRAFVEDVAMICQVPNRAVTGVAWVLQGLHVQCAVCHPSSDSSEAVQAAIEKGAYPTVMALYAQRQCTPDSLDEESTRQRHQAVCLASMKEEIRAAQEAEAEARRETQSLRDAFEKEKQALMKQLEVAQTSSQAGDHDDVRADLTLQEALETRTAQLGHVQASLAESQAKAKRAEDQLTTAQVQLAAAEKRAAKVEADADAARTAADLAAINAEKALEDLGSQLRAAHAAFEGERTRRQTELVEAQAAAAARETRLLRQLDAMKHRLADAQPREKAMEEDEKARQDFTAAADARRAAEHAAQVAELERKLREALSAQASLQEEHKHFRDELARAQAQAAENEKTRLQLQESMESVRKQRGYQQQHGAIAAAIPLEHCRKNCFERAQVRAAEADASLVEALRAQLTAIEVAINFCRAELEVQKSAEAAARERQAARRAAVTAIREKIEDLAENFTTVAAERQRQLPQQLASEKEALIGELIAQLEEVEHEKAEIKTATARAQRLFATMQRQVADAQERAAQLEEARRTACKELQAMTATVSAEDADNSITDAKLVRSGSMQGHQEALVDISARVIAASAALASASDALATHQQQRAAEPKQEEAFIANIFREGDGRRRRPNRECSELAAQIMGEVYDAATGSFLSRHRWTWMNVCLGVLLLLSFTTLQYKKYEV